MIQADRIRSISIRDSEHSEVRQPEFDEHLDAPDALFSGIPAILRSHVDF